MPNMSYCRFENTFHDLFDCYANLNNENLSDQELKYKNKLIKLCVEIALDYGHDEIELLANKMVKEWGNK